MTFQTWDIIFFLEGRLVPSSRFRVEAYQKLLEGEGIKYLKLYSFPAKYSHYPADLAGSPLKWVIAALSLMTMIVVRIWQIICFGRRSKVIFLQRDLLHRVPSPLLEKFLCWYSRFGRNRSEVRVVLDIDDAIFYSRLGMEIPSLRKKLQSLSPDIDVTIVGNTYLAEQFGSFARCVVIPTSLDSEKYRLRQPLPEWRNPLRIGWTGSSSNLDNLLLIKDALEEVNKNRPFTFLVISDHPHRCPIKNSLFPIEFIEWNPDTEIDDMLRFDIGVMPLHDNAWTRGKCGLKLLQYMALGIPAVASPVGVTNEIILNGQNGFLAGDADQWKNALMRIYAEPEIAKKIREAARNTVQEKFRLEDNFYEWIKVINPTSL